jgi:carbonic anhydrase/acetyltransferase-like protein (isoleucine patch superfamily)
MSATVLNGARIGTGSLVGAGALVTEGKQFEPGMLIVGSPAKAARALAEGDIERLKGSSQHYVHNGHRFRDGLRRID